ncbi:MAG: hypothetical protein WBY44_19400 [Bryobacteraceae bacterium]|jgi:hypothetical protein
MSYDTVSLLWREPALATRFQTAVCLHGHTLHSEECLSFLPTHLRRVPGVSHLIRQCQRRPTPAVDFSRAFWTPPLAPACALRLERKQIADCGLAPIVSLTDHDSIAAGMALQETNGNGDTPISVEWTAPYEQSILHFGIHNLPPDSAAWWMSVMASYTTAPDESLLPSILRDLDRIPEVLIVLNHPYWLEEGVTEAGHRRALARVLRECLDGLHAFELNGTRGWSENSAVIDLARQYSRPVISGGDRHACEASACLNLTNAATFAEFAGDVRSGHSHVLFMPHYREPMPLRILEAACDILRPYPEYPGRERWTQRVFYRGEDGIARPLSVVWKNRVPWFIHPATGMLQLSAMRGVRFTLRRLMAFEAEALP